MPSFKNAGGTFRPDISGCFEDFSTRVDRLGFVGLKALPVIEVAKPSGTFGRIPISQMLQNRETLRAPSSGYARASWTFDTETFATKENGLEEVVDEKEAQMFSLYFEAERVTAERCLHTILLNQEKRILSSLTDTGVFTVTPVTHEWSNVQSATPVDDVDAAAKRMWEKTGMWPNCVMMNMNVYKNLRKCDQILEQIKFTSRTLTGDINIGHIASAFDLPFVLVSGGAMNAKNDPQSAEITPIMSSEYCCVMRICTDDDIRTPGVGRTFHWGEDGSTIGGTVEQYASNEVRGNVIRVRMETDEKIIYPECCELLSNITA